MPKPPRQFWKDFHTINAPTNIDKSTLPTFMTQEPYKMSGEPRGKPEQILQIAICKHLRKLPGIFFWANVNHLYINADTPEKKYYLDQQRMAGMRRGVPDLSIIANGKIILAEVKAGANKATDEQENCIDEATQCGAICGVVRSIEDIEDLLRTAGYNFPHA